MLEKPVFETEELKKLILEEYGLSSIKSITRLSLGSAQCYELDACNEKYFLKEFQSKYDLEDLLHEEEVAKVLASSGISTSTFISTKNKKFLWKKRGKVFQLQKYIEGKSYSNNTAPNWLLRESSRMLAKINNSLKEVKSLKDGFSRDFLTPDSINTSLVKLEKLRNKIRDIPSSQILRSIEDDLVFKIKKIEKFNLEINLNDLTWLNTHGDYSILQILITNPHKINVIDLTCASRMPICWEIVRSYSYADPLCAKGKLSIKGLKEYVTQYMKMQSLTEYDLVNMSNLYYLQILKSTFGYKEFLSQDVEDKNALLNFARWRTNVCRWLNENNNKLCKELLSI
ncbi:MAG: phosphotransferase [Bacteriovoracaceae bacterium]